MFVFMLKNTAIVSSTLLTLGVPSQTFHALSHLTHTLTRYHHFRSPDKLQIKQQNCTYTLRWHNRNSMTSSLKLTVRHYAFSQLPFTLHFTCHSPTSYIAFTIRQLATMSLPVSAPSVLSWFPLLLTNIILSSPSPLLTFYFHQITYLRYHRNLPNIWYTDYDSSTPHFWCRDR